MHETKSIPVPLLVLFLSAAVATPLFAQTVPWKLLEGADGLGGGHRNVVAQVLAEGKCYGECKGTILECLVRSPDDPIARRLADFVVRRAAANNSVEEIVTSVKKRKLSAFPIKTFSPDFTGLVPSGGNADAPVQVIVYADFECPYCRVASTALRKISLELPDKVAFYFKNFPLKSHEQSVPAAVAFLAGARQGKFWELHDLLFEHQEDLSDKAFDECAKKLGLDMKRFAADRKDPAIIDRLRDEKTEGMKCGIKKSPGILVNGKPYYGVKTEVELRDRIEEELYLLSLK